MEVARLKIKSITVHNYRSIINQTIYLRKYSVIVGANNSGKSNFINAIRTFYEDIKFNEVEDFPKFGAYDDESWIEIEYKVNDDEFELLKEEYRLDNNTFKVRKYLKSKDRVKSANGNFYVYTNGELSDELFYNAKNIKQARLGSIVYIPAVNKIDDIIKTTGPSPLKSVMEFVFNKAIGDSHSYEELCSSFDEFNESFRNEPVWYEIKEYINEDMEDWNISFELDVNKISANQIIKYLLDCKIMDKALNQEMDVTQYGQGLQRNLIYTLIKASSKYRDTRSLKKADFDPHFKLILFEEPEAFLHPSQQESLNISLRDLGDEKAQQVIVTSHSPMFISKNIDDLPSLIKLKQSENVTEAYQIDEDTLSNITKDNLKLKDLFNKEITSIEEDMEKESIRYFLWLDSERSSAFFSEIVFICEGASEKALFDHLLQTRWKEIRDNKVYVMDSLGKYNVHRFMNLFKDLGMPHIVIIDKDKTQANINKYLIDNYNQYTRGFIFLDEDLESFLDVSRLSRQDKYKKPLNIMWHYFNNKIEEEKIILLEKTIKKCLANYSEKFLIIILSKKGIYEDWEER